MDMINMMNAFLKLGEISSPDASLEDKVKYKERIVFATMRASIPDWKVPAHYNELDTQGKYDLLVKLEKITTEDTQ
jgi:hypothetical protein